MYLKELAHITDRALPVIIYAIDPAEVEREAAGAYALAGVEIISRQLENRTRQSASPPLGGFSQPGRGVAKQPG